VTGIAGWAAAAVLALGAAARLLRTDHNRSACTGRDAFDELIAPLAQLIDSIGEVSE